MDLIAPQLILAVVPRSYAQRTVKAALAAGASGATHWHGHGTGTEHVTLFDAVFRFAPERDVIAVVVDESNCGAVFDAITGTVPVDLPGVGFVTSLPLDRVAGLPTPTPLPH